VFADDFWKNGRRTERQKGRKEERKEGGDSTF
jgi:hypothetical protein